MRKRLGQTMLGLAGLLLSNKALGSDCAGAGEQSSTKRRVATTIDHTNLRADATRQDILNLCQEAERFRFASVCVNPVWVPLASEQLKGSEVAVCSVVGFPLGATSSEVKTFEAEQAISNGATEIDMVMSIGKLKEGDYEYVAKDIFAVASVCKEHNAVCKVIIETSMLTEEEKCNAAILCVAAGADYVKTSTGFSTGGATVEDVKLLASITKTLSFIPHEFKVKASGGIRTLNDALAMLDAGASRLGASRGVEICSD